MKIHTALAVFFAAFSLSSAPAQAGLDLQNQTEIKIGDLDLNHDHFIKREEVAEYMFYYFDHDGNESLTNGEYGARRPVSVIPYEGTDITTIDLDNDGKDDGVAYSQESFLSKVMIGKYDPAAEGITAKQFIDTSFLRLNSNKSGAIELSEWNAIYEDHGVIKPVRTTKAGKNERYN